MSLHIVVCDINLEAFVAALLKAPAPGARLRKAVRRYFAVPFVLVPGPGKKTILGYYTLSSFAIDLSELPPEAKPPSLPHMPTSKPPVSLRPGPQPYYARRNRAGELSQ